MEPRRLVRKGTFSSLQMRNRIVLAVWYEPDYVKYAVYTSDHNLERKSPRVMDQRLLVGGECHVLPSS